MAERLFGMEIEYGCAFHSRESARTFRDRDWPARFMGIARDRLPHLPVSDGNGIFIENGGRFYIDCNHPEMTTPECSNPSDLVRYMLAGESILASIALSLKQREPKVSEVVLFKTNVDHSGSGATWGCHQSFMHRSNPGQLPEQIIPHLASRIIYSGAGGLQLADGRLRFTLSPRVAFLEREVSDNSTSERGIFHTKDETLAADGYHRLHIICGESLCSEIALWLTTGVTAIIVAMIEAGVRPGDGVSLESPLNAMRLFSVDPACQAVALTTTGQALSAVQIQRHYLKQAEAHLHDSFMPSWAHQVCVQWRKMLERLENGAPASVATILDWAIKYSVFMDRAQKRGLRAEHWHHNHAIARSVFNKGTFRLMPDAVAPKTPDAAHPAILAVHQELCEIDTRFGQLGGNGIFAMLDRAGVLGHHVAGVDNIEQAVAHPPAIGRARLRGQCVQRYAGQAQRFGCSWRHVIDNEKHLLLDLSDPFAAEENWQNLPAPLDDQNNPVQAHLLMLLRQAQAVHDCGDYENAAALLRQYARLRNPLEPALRDEYLRIHAWVQSRRGFLDGIAAINELAQSEPMTLSLVNRYVCCYRYQGLIPPRMIEPWISRGRDLLRAAESRRDSAALPFLGHWGYFLLRHGRAHEAQRTLRDACQPFRRENATPEAVARALADLGDSCRALGLPSEAAALLDEAERIQIHHQFEGDLSDFVLTYRAKLEADSESALKLLNQAETIQTRLRNVMGEARSLLLQARLRRNLVVTARLKSRLVALRESRPALSECRRLATIMAHWEEWTTGAPDPGGGNDPYWWL